MAGWIIQGVRGEGKSLCAVYKARDYLMRGCPVATNLDLYLDGLVPPENSTISYRLPDKPRFADFKILGEAYDRSYKGDDKNGLLILDELGTWLNSRSWKDKERDEILNWLFLSRKIHWDIILLAQDHEMIDKQAKTTLCDYLVQASRTDRKKIPYIGRFLDYFGIDSRQSLTHEYDVYYGFHQTGNHPVDKWRFTGKDVYDGYDTNQLFTDGHEVIDMGGMAKLVDFRAIYTNLPSSYLSGYHYEKPHLDSLEKLRKSRKKLKGKTMASRVSNSNDLNKPKLILLAVVAIGFVGYRIFNGIELPNSGSSDIPNQIASNTASNTATTHSSYIEETKSMPVAYTGQSNHRHLFLKRLIDEYKPRVGSLAYHPELGSFGSLDFYQGDLLVEHFTFRQLKALGASIVPKSYGVDLITDSGTFVVTQWKKLPKINNSLINPENDQNPIF